MNTPMCIRPTFKIIYVSYTKFIVVSKINYPALVRPGVVQVVQDGREDVQDVARFEHEEEELLVVLAKLPEEHQQLLGKGK